MIRDAHEPRLPLLAWLGLGLAAAVLAIVHIRIVVIEPDAARFSFDSAEYALAGRAWLDTGRLVTPFVHPAALGASPGPPYPLVVGHPLVPALDAIAFALAGPDPLATLLPAVLAYVVTVLLVARLALALCGSPLAAVAGALAFAVTPWSLRFASEGLSEMPFTAFLTAAFLLLWREPARPRPALLGLVLGLAQLTRPVAAPLLPAFVLGLWLVTPPLRRIGAVTALLVGFVPLAALIVLYKWVAMGSPFVEVGRYLLLTGASPEFSVARLNRMTPPPDALEWIAAHRGLFFEKLARNLRSVAYGVWWNFQRWPVLFAAFAIVRALMAGDTRARGFVVAFAAASALLTFLASATVADARMLFPLLPVAIALAMAGLVRAAELLAQGRRVAVALVSVALVGVSLLPLVREWRAAGSLAGRSEFHETEWRELAEGVAPLLPTGALVASDAAPWIAWFTDHPVTLVPLAPAALVDGPERLRPGAVVLTNEWLVSRPGEEAWRELLEARRPPEGFAFVGHVRSGRLEAVVFQRIATP